MSISNAGVAVSQTIAELSYTDFEWLMTINSWVRHMAPTRTNPEQTAKVIVDGIKAKRRRILIASDARLDSAWLSTSHPKPLAKLLRKN
ncbi:hypothetical protein TMS3_0114100 [Pseudomonas taeanensis MS-3]|uniref:Uncharacterized protein n=1 Tax=Pseudomonas taeanensis MS-3 TaxID=1395571 RepID=A0A0A1YIY5_9PSED|nr:hypothetical protein [Pseudomonas taeanensis]KFX68634.1 hypothetical protein TMS3_0114100 [Pseudomonas taeanensis MS-3]